MTGNIKNVTCNRKVFKYSPLSYFMTTIDEHKKIVQEFVEDINEKIKAGLLTERQKIIGFSTSEAATNLFAIFLHSKSLIEPSFNLNHRFFASKRIAEKKFDFEIPNKQQLLDLLIKQESYRNQLCYGRDKSSEIVNSAVKNFFEIKTLIESKMGDEND